MQELNDAMMVFGYDIIKTLVTVGEGELTFFRLLCQDVAFKRMLSFDFSRASKLEAFFGTRFCFHFWHVLLFI